MKTSTKLVAAFLAVLMSACLFTACAKQPSGGTDQENPDADKAASFFLGATGPLTGDASSYGISVKNGAQLAVQEINAAGGINGIQIFFDMKDDKAIIVGGGIGIPLMLELAKQLECEKTVVLGYRDELFLKEEFEQVADVKVATEDGSCGTQGTVIDAIKACNVEGAVIYACGPMPMLKALAEYAQEHQMEAQISLEERMACGIGACLGCICKSKEKDHHTNVNNKRICKDGPVFDAKEVVFQ